MKKALFLHTQKTAGTSIQVMARRCYGWENVASHADYVQLGRDGCERLPFVSGHFGFEFARPLMSDRYSFTFLRKPVERILSLYAYSASRPPGASEFYDQAKADGFETFLGRATAPGQYRVALFNHQAWQLAYGWGAALVGRSSTCVDDVSPQELVDRACENLAAFDHVGFVETFDADARAIFRALGARWFRTKRANASEGKPRLDSLDAATRALLRDCTELDEEVYHRAASLRMPARRSWFDMARGAFRPSAGLSNLPQ